MKIDILTIFPEILDSYLNESILKRAQQKKLVTFNVCNIRDFAKDKHKTTDDKPYGGGPGMVMKIEPLYNTLKSIKKKKKNRIILLSAKGKTFNQKHAKRLSKYDQLIFICGRYEGVDERVSKNLADEELSIGDYILTGGELPAMVIADSVTRLIPGVLGKEESLKEESFSKEGYLEYPQYTRPEEFNKWRVPKILLSGDHKKIEEWRKKQMKKK